MWHTTRKFNLLSGKNYCLFKFNCSWLSIPRIMLVFRTKMNQPYVSEWIIMISYQFPKFRFAFSSVSLTCNLCPIYKFLDMGFGVSLALLSINRLCEIISRCCLKVQGDVRCGILFWGPPPAIIFIICAVDRMDFIKYKLHSQSVFLFKCLVLQWSVHSFCTESDLFFCSVKVSTVNFS